MISDMGIFTRGLSLMFLFSAGACSTGESNGTGYDRIAATEEIDAELDADDIVCQTTLTLSGTFTESSAAPSPTACWGVGDWSVVATIDRLGCAPQDELEAAYNYTVTHVVSAESEEKQLVFNNDPTTERASIKLEGGSGDCEGIFDHWLDKTQVLSLRPRLNGATIEGTGTFTVFPTDTFPQDTRE